MIVLHDLDRAGHQLAQTFVIVGGIDELERGTRLDDAMTSLGRSLFWKEKTIVGRMLSKWNAEGLAKVAERAGKLERDLMFSDAPEREALGEELLAVARKARNAR